MNGFYEVGKWLFRLGLCVWVVTWYVARELPGPIDIEQLLRKQPLQKNLSEQKEFQVTYNDEKNIVRPVAEYEIWGLVVSHNDPFVWYRFDITHDKKSLDTRDFCVIWGDNLRGDDYKHMSFHNDDFYCGASGPSGITFDPKESSNNHLITDNEKVREAIGKVNIGDQIHIKGKLVNYSQVRWNGQFRNTSTTRTDTEMGACEIIFVEQIEVVKAQEPLMHKLHYIARWVMLASAAAIFISFFMG